MLKNLFCRLNRLLLRPSVMLLGGLCVGPGIGLAHAQLGLPGQDPLPLAVQQALVVAKLPSSALAAVALPLGPYWLRPWAYQGHRPMQPASTMKLVTSIVALDRLGPNARGFTELRSAAPLLADGTLQGDLVLRGGADPDLGVAQFWALLAELRQNGVHTIQGNLLVDRTLWRPARADLGVPPFDEAPEFGYNVIPDALQLAGNLLPLRLSSASGTVVADTVPALPGLRVSGQAMALTSSRCTDWDDDWRSAVVRHEGPDTVIDLQGGFPKACTRRTQLQLLDRTELAERLFGTLWQQLGGRWQGRAVEAAAPANTRVLASRQARPWAEVLRPLNKTSDNAWTRMLYLSLGVPAMADQPQRSTSELSAQVVTGWLQQHHIDTTGLVLDNGSGLSRSARITPYQLASMLKVAHRARYAPDLAMSLPLAGVDGSMRNRLKDSPATGWARLKTGSLRNVAALAGYVNDLDGHPWAVALMINDEGASRGRAVLDAWVDHVARHGVPVWAPVQEP